MNKIRVFFAFVCICFVSVHTKADDITIAIISDGQSQWAQTVTTELQAELGQFSDSQLSLVAPAKFQYHGAWDYDKARDHIRSAMTNDAIDVVVTLGLLASDAARMDSYAKPLIAANVIDAQKQGFPLMDTGSSGQNNLHFLMTNIDLVSELQAFQTATQATKVGILIDPVVFNALPFISETFSEMAQQLDFSIAPVKPPVAGALEIANSIPADVDALLVLPQLQLTQSQNRELIAALNARRLPTYSMLGLPDVESGYLMGSALIPSAQQLARRLAVDIRDIALGRAASELVITFDVQDRLTLNMQTAREIDYSPPFTLMFEAQIINELAQGGRELTLYSAVDEALKRNLDYVLASQDFELAKLDTVISRAALLPQLNANGTWNAQDRDIAQIRQTRTTSLGLGVVQSLYSERNWSDYTATKYLQSAEQASFNTTRLEVIELTAQTYLNVLIAKTELNIQRDNLKLTLANLERAKFRYRVGATSRAEVLRFETELGNDRQSITNAQNDYRQSLNELNRILQRPIQEAFQTREADLAEPKIFGDSRLENFIQTPKQLTIFGDFLTQQAKDNAPELVSLKEQIKAQERLLLAAQRRRYIPDVDLTADVDRIVDDSGDPFVSDYDNDWSLGVQFSWSLFEGKRITAEQSQAAITLKQLKYSYQQQLDITETNTRNAVSQASASRINISYAQTSANAAEQTLELVTDSYVRGQADYIDLIDAQSSYITARLASSNATYVHLNDLISLQRAIGFFDFYVAPEQEEQWFEALNQFATRYEVSK